ncbi:MAG: hypothetical protein AB1540_17110 [Bdellovibrionota bacterium]
MRALFLFLSLVFFLAGNRGLAIQLPPAQSGFPLSFSASPASTNFYGFDWLFSTQLSDSEVFALRMRVFYTILDQPQLYDSTDFVELGLRMNTTRQASSTPEAYVFRRTTPTSSLVLRGLHMPTGTRVALRVCLEQTPGDLQCSGALQTSMTGPRQINLGAAAQELPASIGSLSISASSMVRGDHGVNFNLPATGLSLSAYPLQNYSVYQCVSSAQRCVQIGKNTSPWANVEGNPETGVGFRIVTQYLNSGSAYSFVTCAHPTTSAQPVRCSNRLNVTTAGPAIRFPLGPVAPSPSPVPTPLPTPTPSPTPGPNSGNDRSPVGMNLGRGSYYSTARPFVDALKNAEPFFSGSTSGTWNDGRALDLDENGWVRSLQPGQVARTLVLGTDAAGTRVSIPEGHYTILYDGEGTLQLSGPRPTDIIENVPGRIVVSLTSTTGLFITLTSINPANYLRNLRVIVPGGRCSQDVALSCRQDSQCGAGNRCIPFTSNYQSQIFHPEFLADYRKSKVLRFMDWMETNRESGVPDANESKLIVNWSDYPARSRAFWRETPVDVMVDLSNQLHADPWINIPHTASDDFVRNIAQAIHARLAPDLKVYVEYSNEAWNNMFDQYFYVNRMGCQAFSPNPSAECDPDGTGPLDVCGISYSWNTAQQNCYRYGRYYFAQRTVQVMRIFQEVMTGNPGTPTSRLVRVMGGFTGNASFSGEYQLSFRWNGTEQASVYTDAFAVAPYFGGGEQYESVDAAFVRDGSGRYQILSGPISRTQSDMNYLRSRPAYAHIDLVAYEGGQHIIGNTDARVQTAVAINRDPRMRDVYMQYLSAWADITGNQVFVAYSGPEVWSRFGTWGSKEFQGQPRCQAPKHDALEAFVEQAQGVPVLSCPR